MSARLKPVIGLIRDARGAAGVVLLPSSQPFACECGRSALMVINRNGKTRCVDCDSKEEKP